MDGEKNGLCRWRRHFQILVQRLATDSEFTRERCFLLAGAGAAAQLDRVNSASASTPGLSINVTQPEALLTDRRDHFLQ